MRSKVQMKLYILADKIRAQPRSESQFNMISYLMSESQNMICSEIIYAECVYKYLCLNF